MSGRLRRAVERHPLLWVAAAATSAVLVADGSLIAGLVACAAVLILLLAAGAWRITLAAFAIAAAAGLLHGWRIAPQQAARSWIEVAKVQSAEVTAKVLSPPKIAGSGWSALVGLEDGQPSGTVWYWGGGVPPALGETIRANGLFKPFPELRNPGTFDVGTWLYRQGAWGLFEAKGEPVSVRPPSTLDRFGETAREWFRNAVTSGLDPASREAAVIRAMVLGDNPTDDEPLVEAYRASGTLHVFSVSGMHVAMVGIIGWFVLKWLGVPRRGAVLILIAGMLGYAWLTGMKPPALRSVTMAAALLGAFFLRRRPDLLNALGFALLFAVLTDGHLIFQAGVQLSFGVVLVMGMAAAWASRPFSWIAWREPYLPPSLYSRWQEWWLKVRQKTALTFGASTAASVGSVPLTLWHFSFLAPISIIASTVIGLAVFALMVLALAAAALSPLPAAQQGVNRANGYVAKTCTGIASFFASVPGGNITLARDRPGKDFLIVYDPGYGGGAAVLCDGGSAVLMDTASGSGYQRILKPSLRHFALRPQSIVLSHPDGGHIGGALEALDSLPIRQILIPVTRARSKTFRDLVSSAGERGIPLVLGKSGQTYQIAADTRIEILHEPDALDLNAVADERVMIYRLHWHGWRILFTSDAGWSTERKMLESGRDLSADVIIAGRHLNDASLGEAFLEAVKPKAIIASHCDFPSQERIPEKWAAECGQAGIRLFHQGKTGAVSLVPGEDGSLEIRGFVDGSSLRLTR
jgi:ComEC/Rec2-related protein